MSELSSTLAHTAAADPLSLTVHSTPDPTAQQRTRIGRLKMLLVLLVCARSEEHTSELQSQR